MSVDIGILLVTAASIGCLHTVLGPDHYVPFVAMGAARKWNRRKTLWVTAWCGVGHVLGSVALGALGLAVGLSLEKLTWFEAFRGDVAAWLLTGFGLAYMAWGLKNAIRSRPHFHHHGHADGTFHTHTHGHEGLHLHPHLRPHPHPHPHASGTAKSITPWALFVIFILGPCEPLIPLLMYPAAQHSVWGTIAVVMAFGTATIATMLTVVYLSQRGIERLPFDSVERYSHALAGAALSLCGLGIIFLGL
jgi:sulfite exporter TauE/SafE